MSDTVNSNLEPMLELFIFETSQLMEQLEDILLSSEKEASMTKDQINEVFRIMHTVKGSSAMMMFNSISKLAHKVEDLFFFIRENGAGKIDFSVVCDHVLLALDFIRNEVYKIENGQKADGDEAPLVEDLRGYLEKLKESDGAAKDKAGKEKLEATEPQESQKFYISKYEPTDLEKVRRLTARIMFQSDCQMENIRAFTVVHNLKEHCSEIYHRPQSLIESENSAAEIAVNGFVVYLTTEEEDTVRKVLADTLFLEALEIELTESYEDEIADLLSTADNRLQTEREEKPPEKPGEARFKAEEAEDTGRGVNKSVISVNINKLDQLMDLVGEIVITEAMVTSSSDLEGLQLDNFSKNASSLRKLTDELQDIVMAMRMIPVGPTFNKMHRIVRDMSKKLGKEVELEVSGEETEVDKSIIDNLGDPLMHLIRNS
ncbi:MAG: chemotaxis protein CheA, partial [Clostridiales bacterium]|nr:chemotaxis protein CheA [Clostridiales bacterium]